MKVACLVKFVPNADNYKYDYEKNVIVRENSPMILNPDDASAVACALELKSTEAESCIEVVSMAPASILPLARDILRIGVGKFTLLRDKMFIGSDTFSTSMTLSRYLQTQRYDVILSGTHTLDGGTAHVPPQLAELLDIPQISGISKIVEVNAAGKYAVVEVTHEDNINVFRVELPAILSLTHQSGYKMPFVRYENINLDVEDKIQILSGDDLRLTKTETGLAGSKTVVKRTYSPQEAGRKTVFVKTDDSGVDFVYQFLRDKGYVNV